MIDEQAVEVVLIGERRLIALRVALEAWRVRAGVVAVEVDVVVERKSPIDSIRLVRAIAHQRDRPVGEDRADPAPPQNVALDAEHAEVGRDGAGARRVVGLNVDGPHAEITHLAGQASAAQNRHGASLVEADPPAEEDGGGVSASKEARRADTPPRGPAAAGAGRPPEVEDPLTLQKELALLREEQAEPRQVDLLLVHLDLREIGVPGEVRRQILGESVLHVATRLAGAVVRDRGHGGPVGRERADHVGLDLERAVAFRHLQAGEGAGRRHAELSRPPPKSAPP